MTIYLIETRDTPDDKWIPIYRSCGSLADVQARLPHYGRRAYQARVSEYRRVKKEKAKP